MTPWGAAVIVTTKPMARVRRTQALFSRVGSLVRTVVVLMALACLLAAGAGATLLYLEETAVLPPVSGLADYQPPAATQVFAADGSLLAEFYVEKRYLLSIDRIPMAVRRAFVAAEDAGFYRHHGIDLLSICRALINNVLGRGPLQGGSTITQQVVKSLLLTPEKSYERKLKEMILAIRLERQLSKDQILELYLNHIYLGSGAYGVAAAARRYFGKAVGELTLGEAALLAGLPQAPSRYSPAKHWRQARARQRYVLRRMVEAGFITSDEAKAAFQQPIALAPGRRRYLAAPYYVEQVRRELEERYGAKAPYEAGLRVYTAADVRMAKVAEEALRRGLEDTHLRRGGSRTPIRHLDAGEMQVFLAAQARRLGSEPLHRGYRGAAAVVEVDGADVRVQLGSVAGELRWRATKKPAAPALAVGDVLRVRVAAADARGRVRFELDPEPEVEGALTAMDPVTGNVKVIVGGYDFKRSPFNRVIQAHRQPGSALKPFVYAAALDHGLTPASIILDAPVALPGNEHVWMPRNYEEEYFGPTSLRDALTFSRNVVTVKLAEKIGLPYLIRYLRRVGIRDPLHRDLSVALGSADVTLLELVAAYTVFANQGRRVDPILITRVVDQAGRTIFDAAPQVREAIPAATAYQVTSMLQSVIRRGTGWRARALGRPAAGKTGTTNDLNDAWFVGYTPHLLAGVWVGFDAKRSLGKNETGGRVAAPIWLRFMARALSGQPIADFSVPPEIVFVRVDRETGERALPGAPGSRLEAFRRGTEPTAAVSVATERRPGADAAAREFLRGEE